MNGCGRRVVGVRVCAYRWGSRPAQCTRKRRVRLFTEIDPWGQLERQVQCAQRLRARMALQALVVP